MTFETVRWAKFHPDDRDPEEFAVQVLEGALPRLDQYQPICEGIRDEQIARLIASAPELLRAARFALRILESGKGIYDARIRLADAVKEAIGGAA